MINRTQALVLGFFLLAGVALVAMLTMSAELRDITTRRVPGSGALAIIGFEAVLLTFLTVLAVGVVRKWRWLFWLLLVAFFAGVLRVPVAILQISGAMSPEGPHWYIALQGIFGLVQVAIAVVMLVGYRRSGVWGAT